MPCQGRPVLSCHEPPVSLRKGGCRRRRQECRHRSGNRKQASGSSVRMSQGRTVDRVSYGSSCIVDPEGWSSVQAQRLTEISCRRADNCHPKSDISLWGPAGESPRMPVEDSNGGCPDHQRQIDDDRPLAELRGGGQKYGAVTGPAGVDFAVQPGEVWPAGPNGAARRRRFAASAGLLRLAAARCRLFGQDPRSTAAGCAGSAMLQVSKVPETLKVREHVNLISSYYPIPSRGGR